MLKLVISRWYLVNSSWVKNVNNQRLISSISGVNISTKRLVLINKLITIDVQIQFSKLDLLHYSTTIYTYLNSKFNLLNKSFTYYPQSLLMSLIKEN